MAITVYSRRYKREIDNEQLKKLYSLDFPFDINDFRNFVYEDVQCPICNVSGAHYVSEGLSKQNGKIVRQAHFAFKTSDGNDAHKIFCDHYNGADRIRDSAGDAFLNLAKDGTDVTRIIRELVCRGIENNIFTQDDIRNMRQWFTELRESGNAVITYSPHVVQIIRASFYGSRDTDGYQIKKGIQNEPWFDINTETYKSLKCKYAPFLGVNINTPEKAFLGMLYSKTFANQAYRLISKDRNMNIFDRRILNDKYIAAMELSKIISKCHVTLRRKLTSDKIISRNNHLLAVSALLLFVSEWNLSEAIKKFDYLTQVKKASNIDAGNIMGMNPFLHYDAWLLIHGIEEMIDSLPDFSRIDEDFIAERKRLSIIYGLEEGEQNQ